MSDNRILNTTFRVCWKMRSTPPKLLIAAFLGGILATSLFVYAHIPAHDAPPLHIGTIVDASQLNKTPVSSLIPIGSNQDIAQALKAASHDNVKVSIAGKRHSMGGQSFSRDGVVLDMTSFNKILSFDSQSQVLTVQSGATWDQIQSYLNPLGLAVIAMQGPNIFTVGGSVSVNAHGWDKRTPSVADSVAFVTLMQADGTVIHCSNTENQELFRLVLGGYGLFGVILEVGLYVTPNTLLKPIHTHLSYQDYGRHFTTVTAAKDSIDLTYADLSIAPKGFLRDVIVSDFESVEMSEGSAPKGLVAESMITRDRLLLNLSRKYAWGKTLRWQLAQRFQLSEDIVSRNNLMRSPAERLRYYSPHDTDILQEYFVPQVHAAEFIDRIRAITLAHDGNLLNCTIRFVRKSASSFLNYAKNNSFAFVLYFNVGKDSESLKRDKAMTMQFIDAALKLGGTFYLPYILHYEAHQLRQSYPEAKEFFELKRKYDPEERFSNSFYARYGHAADLLGEP
jgi:decaprenylphospho-beta-D-ribofuranose 2-oxidase